MAKEGGCGFYEALMGNITVSHNNKRGNTASPSRRIPRGDHVELECDESYKGVGERKGARACPSMVEHSRED
ncbi:hypothetical protein WA026_005899 [Henosepilachna vigintioctopunctata]|uniref:Uncharacterized protein n=1 Tax=Henosepilachna vigintioctopunctata TaxID=420089 RepID=A0AAW1U4L0_9CUCU